jgi:hypothetical protein
MRRDETEREKEGCSCLQFTHPVHHTQSIDPIRHFSKVSPLGHTSTLFLFILLLCSLLVNSLLFKYFTV